MFQGLFHRSHGQRGHLVLIGGAEERSGSMAVLRRTIATNSARHVVVIPTASSYPADLGATYTRAFQDLGMESVDVLDIRHAEEADREEHLSKTLGADLVFFTGGDQVKLVSTLRGSMLLDLIRSRHAGGATLAGTSAGAAAASNPMIFDGDDAGLKKGSVRSEHGFGFLPGITVDTHFMERGRLPRLVQAICMGVSHRGLGLSEDTAMVIGPDDRGVVIGAGLAVTVDGNALIHSTFPETPIGAHYGVDGLKVGFLPAGSHFDLKRWAIIPAEARPTVSEQRFMEEECYEGL